MMWRVPGQSKESQGLNNRMVEIIDLFPTLVELTGLPALPTCRGLDQPSSVTCLQGQSYASEFGLSGTRAEAGKQYAFTQWPYEAWGKQKTFRMGYTVRSDDGFRFTEYVPYDRETFRGQWATESNDPELYDYTRDRWETTNVALDASYANVVERLKAVLRQQYESTDSLVV